VKILLIEDDRDLAEAIRDVLSIENYRVISATDGAEALAILKKSDLPELILLDLMMPGMNGWEFRAAQMRDARLAKIPVVVLTALGALSRPIDAALVLKKPFSLDELLAAVDRFAAKH
jgi:DNA-binding response OmpR family regulator